VLDVSHQSFAVEEVRRLEAILEVAFFEVLLEALQVSVLTLRGKDSVNVSPDISWAE